MSDSNDQLHSHGLFGWLGRQVGHVRKALKSDPSQQRVYRNESVQEQSLPDEPNVKLRRTTIDEVIVVEPKQS